MSTAPSDPVVGVGTARGRVPRPWMLLSGGAVGFAAVIALAWTPPAAPAATQEPAGATREFSVSARRYEFTPPRIEVEQDALVKIDFTAEDIPHSFTIDAYRIAKRANAGQTVTFEFRADKPGTFRYYCNLAIDDGCRQMHGELVVRPR